MELEQIAKLSFNELRKEWDEHIEPLTEENKKRLATQVRSDCDDPIFCKKNEKYIDYFKIPNRQYWNLFIYEYYRNIDELC